LLRVRSRDFRLAAAPYVGIGLLSIAAGLIIAAGA
jgi:hypothetical protein